MTTYTTEITLFEYLESLNLDKEVLIEIEETISHVKELSFNDGYDSGYGHGIAEFCNSIGENGV